jgi:hypothetical protein
VRKTQHRGRDGDMKRHVGGGEQARQAGQRVDGALQFGLEEQVKRAL